MRVLFVQRKRSSILMRVMKSVARPHHQKHSVDDDGKT
jgi:hypothetical protein